MAECFLLTTKQEVIKFTSNYHADYPDLCKAMATIEEVAKFINKGGKGDSKVLGIQKAFGNREVCKVWCFFLKISFLVFGFRILFNLGVSG